MSGPEPRFDRAVAFAFFAGLPEPRRTFAAVADRFGVSDVAVGKVAKRERWRVRARQIDDRARRQAETKIVRERAREITKTLEIIALAESELLERLRAGEAEVRLADLPALVRLRELLLGEATERIEVHEVRLIIAAAFTAAVRYIPASQRQDYLRDLDSAVGGIVHVGELAPGDVPHTSRPSEDEAEQ